MLMLNVLQSYYEYSHDPRVLPFMTKYFRFQLNYKDADFLTSYWAKMRAGDNLESVYWLYNRTGEPWLLELAEKIHRHTAAWSTGVIDGHGVNISQGFREPGIYFVQARKPEVPRRRREQLPACSWASTGSSPAAASPPTKPAEPATAIRGRAARPAPGSS